MTTEPSTTDYVRLAELLAAGTERPWGTKPSRAVDPMTSGDVGITGGVHVPGVHLGLVGEVFSERVRGRPDAQQAVADAALIVAAVNALPALLKVHGDDVTIPHGSALWEAPDADEGHLADALRAYEHDLTFGSTGVSLRGIVILADADIAAALLTGRRP